MIYMQKNKIYLRLVGLLTTISHRDYMQVESMQICQNTTQLEEFLEKGEKLVLRDFISQLKRFDIIPDEGKNNFVFSMLPGGSKYGENCAGIIQRFFVLRSLLDLVLNKPLQEDISAEDMDEQWDDLNNMSEEVKDKALYTCILELIQKFVILQHTDEYPEDDPRIWKVVSLKKNIKYEFAKIKDRLWSLVQHMGQKSQFPSFINHPLNNAQKERKLLLLVLKIMGEDVLYKENPTIPPEVTELLEDYWTYNNDIKFTDRLLESFLIPTIKSNQKYLTSAHVAKLLAISDKEDIQKATGELSYLISKVHKAIIDQIKWDYLNYQQSFYEEYKDVYEETPEYFTPNSLNSLNFSGNDNLVKLKDLINDKSSKPLENWWEEFKIGYGVASDSLLSSDFYKKSPGYIKQQEDIVKKIPLE